jgi:hypothetical protein
MISNRHSWRGPRYPGSHRRHERESPDRQDLILADPEDLDRLRAALQNHGLPLGVVVSPEFAGAFDQALEFRSVDQGPAEILDRHVSDLVLVDLREVMNTGKILIVNLAKGRIGEGPASLLGALLVVRMGLEGLGRAEQEPSSRRDFYVYLDEFQTFATESLANMLSELRKYRVNLILANQYLGQFTDDVRLAILGNVGTLLSFQLGPEDARLIAREFDGDVSASDLMSQPNYEMYLKLMVNGTASRGSSGRTFPVQRAAVQKRENSASMPSTVP